MAASPSGIYRLIFGYLRSKRGVSKWHRINKGKLKGIRLFVNTERHWFFKKMVSGEYDTFIYEIISKEKFNGKTIWDVGAHIGLHTLGFAKVVGKNGRVVAIEPNRFNVERLRKNIEGNPDLSRRVVVIENALGHKKGNAKLRTTKDVDSARSSGGYILGGVPPLLETSYEDFKEFHIRMETVDSILKKNPVLIPDVIKIDVEGAEAEVLRGAKNLLARSKPLIVAEIHNISAMLGVAKILFENKYNVEIANNKEVSVSRCFIIASKK